MITVNEAYYLDKFVSTDQERLAETINDEEIAKNTLTIPYPYSLEDARWWLQRCELQYSSDEPQRSWAIRNSDGQVCGTISRHFKYGFNSHKDEIGYWLMRPLWGQGLMTEVIANFAENYFWAAKLMSASSNDLWAWFYAEICFSMTDDDDLLRSSAILISNSLKVVSGKNWRADPEKLDQDFKFVFSENCATISNESGLELENRKCLLENWKYDSFTISPLFQRIAELESKGWLEAYLATILQENDKEKFLEWLPENVKDFEEYRTWRYWNPIKLMKPINRL